MRIRKSFLTKPGQLTYGARKVGASAAVRLRLMFLLVAIRSAILAGFCFFLGRSTFEQKGFATFNAIADPKVWGWALVVTAVITAIAAVARDARVARVGMWLSGVVITTAGISFVSSAIQFGVGWWGAVAYLVLGAIDFLVASYPGEVT